MDTIIKQFGRFIDGAIADNYLLNIDIELLNAILELLKWLQEFKSRIDQKSIGSTKTLNTLASI